MTDRIEGPAHKIAEALGSSLVQDAGGNYMCACPAHDDHTPSLAIRDSDLGLLVHCFAGCTYANIMAALQRLKLLPEGVTIAADDVSSGEDAPAEEKDGEAEARRPCRGCDQSARRRDGKKARRSKMAV
jgi:hypothetical protein